jgi:hypothetical protein
LRGRFRPAKAAAGLTEGRNVLVFHCSGTDQLQKFDHFSQFFGEGNSVSEIPTGHQQ